MKLESQVCSLDLAKRLKELGVKQESLFYWVDEYLTTKQSFYRLSGDNKVLENDPIYEWHAKNYSEVCSAFTVAELGEMLPAEIYSYRRYGKDVEWPYAITKVGDIDFGDSVEFQKTEADARAKMLIYLIEHGLVKNET